MFNPHVNKDYLDYYINKTSDISPGQKKLLQPLELKKYLHSNKHLLFGRGWSSHEPSHTWTNGKQAHLVLSVVPNAKKIILFGYPFLKGNMPDQHITITVNGKHEFSGNLRDGEQQLVLSIPPSQNNMDKKSLLVDIVLDIPDATSPRVLGTGEDPRLLGFALTAVEVQ